MTPLRRRVLDDLRMRNLSPHTQEAYLRAIAAFARHFGRSPEQLDSTHVREYLLLVVRRKGAWSTYNVIRCALHFLYHVTLKKDWTPGEIVCAKTPKRLPVILSRDEVRRLLAGIPRIKTRTMLDNWARGTIRRGSRNGSGNSARRTGWSTPSRRSAGRNRCSSTWPGTHTGWRSRTDGWWGWTTAPCRSGGRTTPTGTRRR
jgi:hypothetical protein